MNDCAICFSLGGTPVGKGRPRFVRSSGHAYTPDNTRNYESNLRRQAIMAMELNYQKRLSGPVLLNVVAYCPIPKSWSNKKKVQASIGLLLPTTKPDVDNLLKIVGDALNGIIYDDDKQITMASIRKEYSDDPRLAVFVSPIPVFSKQES
tara:strand:- start:100 stop:549 length:450 start_codon:yes stop_codon:yes gene_type:complete